MTKTREIRGMWVNEIERDLVELIEKHSLITAQNMHKMTNKEINIVKNKLLELNKHLSGNRRLKETRTQKPGQINELDHQTFEDTAVPNEEEFVVSLVDISSNWSTPVDIDVDNSEVGVVYSTSESSDQDNI